MSDTVGGILTTLQEMGFSENHAKKALAATQWKGVEAAMEWMLAHPDKGDGEDQEEEDEFADLDQPLQAEGGEEPKEPPKPLTAEEKAEKLKKLEELRVQKRKEREEREKKEAHEKEIKRVKEGKAISGLKEELRDQEIRKAAEQQRREKMETKAAKERVRAQIEADKQARREREAEKRGERIAQPAAAVVPAQPAAPARSYDETRLQIRLTDGTAIVQTFKSKEPLAAVRLYVRLNRKDLPGEEPAKIMTSFPKKVFEDEDYERSLEDLGLAPSSVLIVGK